jgi:hypothetical protein
MHEALLQLLRFFEFTSHCLGCPSVSSVLFFCSRTASEFFSLSLSLHLYNALAARFTALPRSLKGLASRGGMLVLER